MLYKDGWIETDEWSWIGEFWRCFPWKDCLSCDPSAYHQERCDTSFSLWCGLSFYLKHLIIQLQGRCQRYTLKHKLAPLRECCSSVSPYLGHFPSCQERMTDSKLQCLHTTGAVEHFQGSHPEMRKGLYSGDDHPSPVSCYSGIFHCPWPACLGAPPSGFSTVKGIKSKDKKKAGGQNYYVNGNRCTVCSISALLLLEWFVIQISTFLSKEKNKCSVQKHYVHFNVSPSTAGEKKNCCPTITKVFYLEKWYHSFRFSSHYVFLWLK